MHLEYKIMLLVLWNYERVIHFKFVPDGNNIDTNLYSD